LIDQSSVVRFIEDNWLNGERLQPGASFDTIAGSIENMFDFTGIRPGDGVLILNAVAVTVPRSSVVGPALQCAFFKAGGSADRAVADRGGHLRSLTSGLRHTGALFASRRTTSRPCRSNVELDDRHPGELSQKNHARQ
jgi:hypothetical protein